MGGIYPNKTFAKSTWMQATAQKLRSKKGQETYMTDLPKKLCLLPPFILFFFSLFFSPQFFQLGKSEADSTDLQDWKMLKCYKSNVC